MPLEAALHMASTAACKTHCNQCIHANKGSRRTNFLGIGMSLSSVAALRALLYQ
jgi:hypothetical protein